LPFVGLFEGLFEGLLEGIRDLSQPCSLSLVIPGLLVVTASRRRRGWSTAGVVLAIWLFGWMKAAGWLPGTPNVLTSVLVGMAYAATGWAAWQLRGAGSGFASGFIAGGLAAWLWVPCVGRELGEILNAAPDDPGAQIFPMGLFVLGLSIPILVAALLPSVMPTRTHGPIANVALVLVGVVSVALIAGWYDDIVIQLNRWSVPNS